MPEKLFVGGLPFDYSNDQLKSLFAKAGTVVSAVMVPDPKNKRTRGFGFVTFSGKDEAIAAMKMLNGTKVGEKNIYISEAREKPPRRDTPPPRYGAPPTRYDAPPNRFGARPPRDGNRPFRDGPRPFREGPGSPRSFGGPSRAGRPSNPHGFFAPSGDKRASFGPPSHKRKPPRGRPDKPAKKPFYQKFSKPK